MKWMHERGWKYNVPLTIFDFPQTGRGLKAIRRIEPETKLISIPVEKIMITLFSVRKCHPFLKALRPSINIEQVGSHLLLSSYLVFLKANQGFCGQDDWTPYLKSLPEVYTVPFFLNSKTMKALPSYLRVAIKAQEVIVGKNFRVFQNFFDWNTSVDIFAWAWFTVNTRGVFFDYKEADPESDNLALVPFLDLFNHSPDVKVQAGFVPETNCYEIHTETGIDPESQAFINYGPHGNVKLFVEYGFVIPNNPQDCIPITLEELQAHLNLGYHLNQDQRMELLNQNGFHHNMSIHREGCTWNIFACLQILTLESGQLHQWEQYVLETDLESDSDLLDKLKQLLVGLEAEIKHCRSELHHAKNVTSSESVLRSLLDEHLEVIKESIQALKI